MAISAAHHRRHQEARAPAPWVVSDELWELVEPLLPRAEQRMGRKRLPNRPALQGILYVLYTETAWQALPRELGFGSGFTCWRRLGEWQRAGVWDELEALLRARLPAASRFEWSRTALPASRSRARAAGGRRAMTRITGCPAEAGHPESTPHRG